MKNVYRPCEESSLKGCCKQLCSETGITLLEVLLACSILIIAVYMITDVVMGNNAAIAFTDRRLAAMNLARTQLEKIRRTPYSALPPESIDPSRMSLTYQGDYFYSVKLKNMRIVGGSVTVYDESGEIPNTEYRVDEDWGVLYLKPNLAGRKLTANYRFCMPERTEDFSIPSRPPYRVRLFDKPSKGSIRAAEGESELPADAYTQSGRYIIFKPAYAGHLVTISYASDGSWSVVGGKFMNADLSSPSATDSGSKEIILAQQWRGDRTKKAMTFTCIRTR